MRCCPVRFLSLIVVVHFFAPVNLAFIRGASALTIVAGGNLGAPLTEVVVPLNVGDPLSYNFEADLVPDFSAGPILKHFVAGNIYRASQPWPQRIAEHLSVVNLTPALVPIENWHEEIMTPGWEWYLPGAPGSNEWFPTGTILVTRDDQPWDSTVTPLANPQLLNDRSHQSNRGMSSASTKPCFGSATATIRSGATT